MFESKVYECQSCNQFFFFKLDADEHTIKTGHAKFKMNEWASPGQSSPRLNRAGKTPV